MRIRSNVAPTPIVSSVALQQPRAEQPAVSEPVPVPAPAQLPAEPMVIEFGDKQILLQNGELAKVVEKVNETAKVFNHSLQFEVSDSTNHIVIRVIDTEKGEVIREIPPERLLDVFTRLQDTLGLLLDLKL